MKRKKILISIDWFLPGTLSGGPVRSYANLIEHLKDDFEFFIVTRNTDYGSTQPYENITPNTWVNFNDYTKVFYLSEDSITRKKLKALYASIDFDVAYVNGIYSWYFSILPVLIIKKLSKPIIISARGMLNPQAFSVKKKKKKTFLKLARLLSVYKSVKFHATNADEANCIRKEINKNASVQVAPNLPRKLSEEFVSNSSKHSPIKFVNVARIAKEKGTYKMLEALLNIKQPMQLDLFGPIYNENYWKKCVDLISKLPKHIVVNYKGVLESKDVPSTLNAYDFFVLLSEGENFGHAILEAFSVGLPVIISDKTPWKNLKSKSVGWDLDIHNQEAIIEAYKEALNMADDNYKRWSASAFEFARQFISNPKLIEQNKALFLNAVNQNK